MSLVFSPDIERRVFLGQLIEVWNIVLAKISAFRAAIGQRAAFYQMTAFLIAKIAPFLQDMVFLYRKFNYARAGGVNVCRVPDTTAWLKIWLILLLN